MNASSDLEPEANFSNFIPDKVNLSNIEIFNISDSGSEIETEESILTYNKNCLPKLTEIRSSGTKKLNWSEISRKKCIKSNTMINHF